MRKLLEAIVSQPIVVIGDIMLDHYIWGDTSRISPEAPVPVVDVRKDSYRAGGAANVALNIRALGGKVELCGWVGSDEAGEELERIFQSEQIDFDNRFLNNKLPTILKTRVMVRGQQLCRLDREDLPTNYSMEEPLVLQRLQERLKGKKAVVFSDYAKGVVTQAMAESLLAFAKKEGLLVAYDPKPRQAMQLCGVDLMTPNKAEALQLAGITLHTGDEFPAKLVCERIWERFRPHNLVVTLGGDGMLLCQEGVLKGQIPTYAREVSDVSGAGDTVIASLALALVAGASLEEAVHFANTAAGVVVGKLGTAVATPPEVLDFAALCEKV